MRQPVSVFVVLFQIAFAVAVLTQTAPLPPAKPLEAVTALIEAFRTHDIVAVTDPHGNEQMQALLLSLVRDSRFAAVVNDIVIETATARYQDVLDRFVRGEEISEAVLRKAWEEHTVANSLGVQAAEFVRAVRTVNASLASDHKLRVLAGDPPIDWDNVTSGQDHRRWIQLRDSYPADLIRRQVLDRGRRALVVYGQGHLQRAQIVANYDMSTWQAQTVVSLLERDPGVRVVSVWTLLESDATPEAVASWPVPSFAIVRGTDLGVRDFGTYSRLMGGTRVAVRDGQLVQIPREDWKPRRLDEQFDALLYLGPPSSFTVAKIPPSLCQDSAFVERRLQRLAMFGPPVEVQNLKKACGVQ
jgi:hypothetical protein